MGQQNGNGVTGTGTGTMGISSRLLGEQEGGRRRGAQGVLLLLLMFLLLGDIRSTASQRDPHSHHLSPNPLRIQRWKAHEYIVGAAFWLSLW